MKKNLLKIILFCFILASCFTLSASATEIIASGTCGADGDKLTWSLDESGLLTISGSGEMRNYYSYSSIPWYSYKDDIISISIGNSVTTIGEDAFYYCTGLTSVDIPNSVTTIGNSAFRGCSGLTSLTIGNSVTEIGNSAFEDCSSLTSVTIGNSVTTIGVYAFYNCTSLTSVDIPNSVTTIGNYAFRYCERLTSVIIGNSVTTIGDYIFYGCSSLTSIDIPDSVTTIGDGAFWGCSGLTSVAIGNSVTTIAYSAFRGCSSLTSVTIGNSVTTIGNYAFRYCESLTSVTIGNSVTTIDNYAFEDCSSLTSIDIPDSVTTIGAWAFDNCTSLTSVTIGNSVTTIGNYAFDNCTSLTSITVDEANQYYSSDERGALFNKDKTKLIQYPIGNSATTYKIPDDVTTIGNYAFRGCSGLTRLTIGNSVTTIGDEAFCNCSKLTSVDIPDSVTTIGNYAFSDCESLTSVTIGNGITSIGNQFDSSMSLENIIIPKSVTNISVSAFDSSEIIIHGFTGSAADSFATSNGIPFVSLDGFMANYIDGGKCGDNAYWELYRNGKMLITGTGKMYNDRITKSSYVRTVEIADGITNIGSGAFDGCYGLTSISLPNSITSIGYSAFYNCSSLTSVDIPNSVTTIGKYAFYNCSKLTSVDIPDSVTTIGYFAFYNCSKLTSVDIPDSVTTIGYSAFYNCTNLTSVTIGNSVTTIDEEAFGDCDSIEKVNITSVEDWMDISFSSFESNPLCYGADLYLDDELLINLEIPSDKTKIKNYAFYGCESFKTITIPKTVTSIPDSAFTGCNNATIYGYANTCAETTARANILPFVALDENWQPKLAYNGKCGDNLMWQLYQNGKLVISFMNDVTTDVIYDFTSSSKPTWNTYGTLVRNVEFPRGITRVGDNAFDELTGIICVYYSGDEESWKGIEVGNNNAPLNSAYKLYNESLNLAMNYKDVVKTTAIVNGKVIPVIINLVSGTTWQELKENLIYSDYTDVIVYDHDGNLIESDDFLSTGYIMHHINKDVAVIEEILISVSGDVTGDSIVGVDDVQNVVAHLAGDDILINKIAIDTNLDDVLTMEELNTFIRSFKERD